MRAVMMLAAVTMCLAVFAGTLSSFAQDGDRRADSARATSLPPLGAGTPTVGFSEKWQDNIKVIDELGGPRHFNHFPSAWAHAMDTPFQWTKQVASHFGGTRSPMIISWPARIKDLG